MQTSNQSSTNFDNIKLPKRILPETILFLAIMISFETWFILKGELIQSIFYGLIVLFYFSRAVFVFYTANKSINLIKLFKKKIDDAMMNIKNTPVIREEGKSIIFTFVRPSNKLMYQIEKLKNEYK